MTEASVLHLSVTSATSRLGERRGLLMSAIVFRQRSVGSITEHLSGRPQWAEEQNAPAPVRSLK